MTQGDRILQENGGPNPAISNQLENPIPKAASPDLLGWQPVLLLDFDNP